MNSNEKIKNEKRQIIYAWDYVEWGGAQIYFFALIKEVKKEFDVRIILPKESDEQLLKFIEALDVPYEFAACRSDLRPANSFKRKLERHVNKFRSERAMVDHLKNRDLKNSIVHVELAPWQSLFALLRLVRSAGVFITAHNSIAGVPKWRRILWKIKLALISQFENFNFFASNNDSKTFFSQFFPPEFQKRMRVTYTSVNPIEIDAALDLDFDKNELKRKFKISQDKMLVLCVGQFIDRKGRWTFLEAAKRVAESYSDIAFVWISNSKPSVEDLEKAAGFELGENFCLITSDQVGKERTELFKLFQLADIFALPSFVEGLPISLLEAMALGIPSISTNVNAIPEAVKHLETGILIEAGDSAGLANAIVTLKRDENLRQTIAQNGREFVLKHFDEREVAKVAIAAYKEFFARK